MRLHDAWKRLAYDTQGQAVKNVWDDYLAKEREVYKRLLREKKSALEGTAAELGEQLNLSPTHIAAFIDGIRECVDGLPVLEELEESTPVSINFDWERLYRQMVDYKAEDLYSLPEWKEIFTEEEQKQLYISQKKSHTVIRNEAKIGRNDPCPCGSGKKYKKCCGASVE